MIAEAAAAAFVNVRQALRNGNGHRLKPMSVAHYAVLHAKDGRHVGGGTASRTDVMSRKAQRRGGFKVVGLSWDSNYAYDCMGDASASVWRQVLLEDKRTPVPDQARFRIDWSSFLRGQDDRTRGVLAKLASGYRQVEVAEHLGVTPAAVCQRVKRAEREWLLFQGETVDDEEGGAARRS
jgi:hypothetical protein